MKQQFTIEISGAGTSAELAKALRTVADQVAQGYHIGMINVNGSCEWQDETLITEINEGESEEELSDEEKYPRADWQYDVANGDTKLGYREWVEHNKASEGIE